MTYKTEKVSDDGQCWLAIEDDGDNSPSPSREGPSRAETEYRPLLPSSTIWYDEFSAKRRSKRL